jgi:superfamily II DNA or RNA helicase
MIQMMQAKGKGVVVLINRKKLITQSSKELGKHGVVHGTIQQKRKWGGRCNIASIQTVGKWDILPPADFVIVDECHLSIFDKAVERYKEAGSKIIGFTATPWRLNPPVSLAHYYEHLLQGPQIDEIIAEGYLNRCEIWSPKVDLGELRKEGGEFTIESQEKIFNSRTSLDCLLKNYMALRLKKSILFCPSVESSKEVASYLCANGIKALHVDAQSTDDERDYVDNALTNGDLEVICNCALLTFGYDNPIIDTVIIFRATTSLALWLQMAGRGSRLYEGKDRFHVIDFGGNCIRHGHWQIDRDWQEAFEQVKKKKETEEVIPIYKDCPTCFKLLPQNTIICPDCGTELDVKTPIKQPIEKELIHIPFENKPYKQINFKAATPQELETYAKAKGYKANWVGYQLTVGRTREQALPLLIELGRLRNKVDPEKYARNYYSILQP